MILSLISIVREASKLMLVDSFDVSQKEGFANIVTSSDVAVQDFLKARLAKLLPGSGFLCEEEDRHDLSHEFTWIIDPIDGTANYSRGIRECAICVGLKHGDAMEMAVVYLPRTDELFHAERGKGAFLNGRSIHVSERPFANSIMCTALAVYHKEYAQVCSDIIVETFLQCNDIRRFGAAAPELCYLAMGRCELYFEISFHPGTSLRLRSSSKRRAVCSPTCLAILSILLLQRVCWRQTRARVLNVSSASCRAK